MFIGGMEDRKGSDESVVEGKCKKADRGVFV